MATFQPVNTGLAQESFGRSGEETNPTTPRPTTTPSFPPHPLSRDDAVTPTKATFGAMATQRPLPTTSFPGDVTAAVPSESPKPSVSRGDSQHSVNSRESEDVDMDDSDEGEEGSDDESVNADGTRSSKKKKSQRFYCTEYPPCTLSFTRSEHLARHIRKHTGERPFQCHCSRRFSRLDNLRQHAQTVHQNEEIPQDSLAATGTRFQRQVRTDRVRPPGSRARASTAGSQTQGRGHSRNSLSASSIGSVASVYSQASDARRRPTPLVMAGDPRQRYSQEMYRPESPSSQYAYRPDSREGFSTPTSATFSTGQNSPRPWGSAMQSPISSHSRTASIYAGHRTPGRRLSVPSAGNPFQSPHANSFGPPILSQGNPSGAGPYSPASSMLASPTSSTAGSWSSRRESTLSASDEAWRRRTWHPDSQSFTSRLQTFTTPNHYATSQYPQPPVVPSNAPPLTTQNMRLPGIESFDPLPRPTTPIRRQPSPMMVDTPSRVPQTEPHSRARPNSQQWDMGINRNLNRLDIAQGPPDTASSWASEANNAVQAQAEQHRGLSVRFEESTYSARPHTSGEQFHPHHASAPPVTPKSSKRQAWYHGPVPAQPSRPVQMAPIERTSPAESSSSEGGVPGTPSSNVADVNPSIVHSSGWVESRNGNVMAPHHTVPPNTYATYSTQHGGQDGYVYNSGPQQSPLDQRPQPPMNTGNNMLRLEALVAVAAAKSEENAAIQC